MDKIRPEMVAEYLEGVFSANSINIEVGYGGGSFKIQLPNGLKGSDIQTLSALLILRYAKFKYNADYLQPTIDLLSKKVNDKIKDRVNAFIMNWEKNMVQPLGTTIKDINKKPLFHKDKGLQNATAIKFSHLNIGGQQSSLKKLGLGVEFIESGGSLSKIYIHRFNNKH